MVYYHAFPADWIVREQIMPYSLDHVSQQNFTHVYDFTGRKSLKQLHQAHSPVLAPLTYVVRAWLLDSQTSTFFFIA